MAQEGTSDSGKSPSTDLYPIIAAVFFVILAICWLTNFDLYLTSQLMPAEQAMQLHLYNGWLLLGISLWLITWLYLQRRQFQRLAFEANQRFDSTFSQSAVGMAHVSREGYFLRVNHRFSQMLQYEAEALIGKSFHDVTHPDDLADDLLKVEALSQGEIEHYELEKRYRRRDGSYFWANLSVSMQAETSVDPGYFIAVIEDIDTKKQATLARESSMAQVQLLLDATGDAIIGIAASTDITFANQAALQQLGYQTTSQVLGLPMLTLIAKQKMALAAWRDIAALINKPAQLQGETDLLVDRHGDILPCAYRVMPVPRSEDGTVLVLCFQNIRERRQQQLKQHAQTHLLHRLLDNAPVEELLTELVNFVEQQLPTLKCSILLADLPTQQLRVAAGPSLPNEYNQQVDGLPIHYGNGSCGTAAATGKPVIVSNVRTDLLWQSYQDLVKPYDWLQACWSTPFFSSQKMLLGTFAIYANQTREPNSDEQDLIQFTTSLAAFLVERSDAKARFDLLSKAVEQSPIAIIICDATGQITYVNHQFDRLTGLQSDTILGQQLTSIYPADLQPIIAKEMQQVMAGMELAHGQLEVVRTDGRVYWQKYCLRAILDPKNQSHLLLEIEDITVQKRAEQQWMESELRFRTLLDNTPEISVQGYEADGTTFYWNKASEKVYGYSHEEAIGRNLLDLIIPNFMRDGVKQAIADMAATGVTIPSEELLLQRKDGTMVPVYSGHAVVKLKDKPAQIFCMDLDLTERKKQDEALRLSSAVFNSSREGILITDTERRIISVNPALEQLFGYSQQELIGQTPTMLRSGRHSPEFYEQMWSMLEHQHYWQGEVVNRRKDGETLPLQLSISAVFNEHQQISHYAAIFTDLSQIRATEAEMAFLSDHDELTHLPNRHLFLQLVEQALKVARRDSRGCAVLVLDLDHFKDVNDSYGHVLGDELLLQVSRKLKMLCRDIDVLSRLGGDEFAILVTDLQSPEDAARIAMKMIAEFSQPWLLSDQYEVTLGVSIGISVYPQHASTTLNMLQGADAALYKAKAAGRNTYTFFSDEFTQGARERLTMEANLRKAIRLEQLQVFYQPQVDIQSGRIIGAEALVRWFDPEQGMISPARFIPVAEACGLINNIGRFVLQETCRQGQQWLQQGLPQLTLAVNVSPIQFKRFDMHALVTETLAETGFPPHSLELELTESALMENEEAVIATLNRLRSLGIRLAIDDFGTGYSSLAYLKRFPLDVLKIDKKFIDDIPGSTDDMEIATAIIGIAHTLGFKVLAEGVETATQLEFLRTQHCDHYQGYYCSPPVPAAKFELLLQQHMVPTLDLASARRQ
ncbi:MAG: PAS domain S-box protein [Rheinheimera sp.]